MADLQMKTIRYPGINNLYRFMQPDGSYPDLSAGNIISPDAYTEDTKPYLFRALPYKSKRLEDVIVGGSVVWNQLVPTAQKSSQHSFSASATYDYIVYQSLNIPVTNGHKYLLSANVSRTIATNNRLSVLLWTNTNEYINATLENETPDGNVTKIKAFSNSTKIDKISFNNSSGSGGKGSFENGDSVKYDDLILIDLTQMLGSTIADYVATLESGSKGAGVAWLKSYGFFTKPYYEYDAGTLKSVNPTAHVTVGKNQGNTVKYKGQYEGQGVWNGDLLTRITTEYIGVIPNTDYFIQLNPNNTENLALINYNYFDADKNWLGNRASNGDSAFAGATEKAFNISNTNARYVRITFQPKANDTDNIQSADLAKAEFQFAFGTARTAYEPYEEHTYDLGNVPLYGLFKLENNKLKAYGDVRHAVDGTDRKFGLVDLGTLNWYYNSGKFVAVYPSMKKGTDNILCQKYTATGHLDYITTDKTINTTNYHYNDPEINIYDSAYSDAATFKQAMSGVMLNYEKNTPTTEDTPSFEKIQSCFPYGTEEYITTNGVPVGHNTKYFKDVISSIAGIPEPPSGNGTYELKLTVTDGVASYSWVVV